MPAQKRLRRHDQSMATPWRKQSGKRRKQSTIGWPQRGARLLPAEHDELMSQHEQLDVFSELAAPASDQQPKHSREGEIGERKEHEADASIARYRAQDEQERRSWTSVTELRSPARSGIRARTNLQNSVKTSATDRRRPPNRNFETPQGHPSRSHRRDVRHGARRSSPTTSQDREGITLGRVVTMNLGLGGSARLTCVRFKSLLARP